MATRTVIFDFYGTLVRPATPTPTLAQLIGALGVELSDELAARWGVDRLDGITHEEASRSEADYIAWEDRRWTGMLREAGVADDRIDGIIHAMRAQIALFRVAPFDETAAVLAGLRDRGLRIGICSNWHWDLDSYLEETGIAPLVDVAVTSARVGARKHHPLIYARTLEAMDTAPQEALFVGDSWEPDVVGPVAAGMRAVHVARRGGELAPLPPGAVRVADLTEVPAHL